MSSHASEQSVKTMFCSCWLGLGSLSDFCSALRALLSIAMPKKRAASSDEESEDEEEERGGRLGAPAAHS